MKIKIFRPVCKKIKNNIHQKMRRSIFFRFLRGIVLIPLALIAGIVMLIIGVLTNR